MSSEAQIVANEMSEQSSAYDSTKSISRFASFKEGSMKIIARRT